MVSLNMTAEESKSASNGGFFVKLYFCNVFDTTAKLFVKKH